MKPGAGIFSRFGFRNGSLKSVKIVSGGKVTHRYHHGIFSSFQHKALRIFCPIPKAAADIQLDLSIGQGFPILLGYRVFIRHDFCLPDEFCQRRKLNILAFCGYCLLLCRNKFKGNVVADAVVHSAAHNSKTTSSGFA
ncbi:hypothetical protein SDC9_170413 [bioreactor metagenome]|uniref:Uncharacterized protein n=1 Tax=bioreactor metagenome TaxID=1076179 RepID=A0A645G811_9ZZZZ